MDYWRECLEQGFEECGIKATKEQIDFMVDMVEGAHDCYGMAFGHDCIPDPLEIENKELKRKLEREKNSVHCEDCNGTGRIYYNSGGTIAVNTQCHKCGGNGRIY